MHQANNSYGVESNCRKEFATILATEVLRRKHAPTPLSRYFSIRLACNLERRLRSTSVVSRLMCEAVIGISFRANSISLNTSCGKESAKRKVTKYVADAASQ